MAGRSLADIADELEFPTAAAVGKAIRDQLSREATLTPAEDRAAMITLENDRLTYMLAKVWQQVEFGDLKAIETALKVIAMRIKLNQLDAVDTSTATTQVLVVGGLEAEYIDKLKGLMS